MINPRETPLNTAPDNVAAKGSVVSAGKIPKTFVETEIIAREYIVHNRKDKPNFFHAMKSNGIFNRNTQVPVGIGVT